jgi:predicted nucleic acid-binding protein
MLALDASAAVDLLLRTPRGHRVAQHLRSDDVTAPELLDVEVCSAVARLQRAGAVTEHEADDAVRRLATMPVRRLAHLALLPAAWPLRGRVRVADAFYVACAQLTSGALLTCDARLAAAPLPGVAVTVVR